MHRVVVFLVEIPDIVVPSGRANTQCLGRLFVGIGRDADLHSARS